VPADFGLTAREARLLRSLTPPIRLQRFLDDLDYDVAGGSCRSPRRALRERRVQCLDGALLAAAALRLQGQPALLFDLEAVQDDDHVLALFRSGGCWGAVGRSNYAGLRYREPVHRTLRELAVSYFDEYFNLRGERTLRRYSRPVSLRPFDALEWMTSEHDLWPIAEHLVHVQHYSLLTPAQERRLARVDRRRFHAGLHGRQTT
jgi:hypothetical protein